jgi:hypothetical protein
MARAGDSSVAWRSDDSGHWIRWPYLAPHAPAETGSLVGLSVGGVVDSVVVPQGSQVHKLGAPGHLLLQIVTDAGFVGCP